MNHLRNIDSSAIGSYKCVTGEHGRPRATRDAKGKDILLEPTLNTFLAK